MDPSQLFIALGALFLAGLGADALGRRTALPRVTLLLLCGIAIGQSGLGLLPGALTDWYQAVSVIALTLVAFLLGNALRTDKLARNGRAIIGISLVIVIATLAIVATGLWLAGVPPEAALVLGAIATATDPAAMQDTLRQSRATGRFADMLEGIVAIDDAWGLIVFALALSVAHALTGGAGVAPLADAMRDLAGAVALGLGIGLPAAVLTGRLRRGEPLQTEALGVVFLTAGLALWLEVSYLLAGMVAGMIIANFARHHDRAFHEIEHLQGPFMILFFLLAGATFALGSLWQVGLIGLGYVILRILARGIGGWAGATLTGTDRGMRPWFGIALLPQAGVAVGMALVAARELPHAADLILTVTIGTTILFEMIGPAATLIALRQTGRAQDQ